MKKRELLIQLCDLCRTVQELAGKVEALEERIRQLEAGKNRTWYYLPAYPLIYPVAPTWPYYTQTTWSGGTATFSGSENTSSVSGYVQ